eukprot:PITA_02543
MAFNGLRLKYALDGSSNYIAWKDSMEVILEDNGLKDFIDQEFPKLVATNAQVLAEWKKCVVRARRILLEGVQDHIVSSLHGRETPFSMQKTLKDLYQNNNELRKLALKNKLQKIKREKGNTISTYLNKLTTWRDDIGILGITTTNDDMVSLALLDLPKSWHCYQDLVNKREKLPDLERLWLDLMQEEIRRSTRDGSSSKEDEENFALASKERKGKEKDSHAKLSCSHGGKKIDKSNGCGWFLDSGASFHMTNDKILFSTLEEKDLQMHIEMGNDEKYSVSGVGTVALQREHGALITLTDMKYVPGLKKNLLSIAMMEEKGCDVVLSKGKVFLRHITMR